MKPPQPCANCGLLIRAYAVAGHPWRHIGTGSTHCAGAPRATPAVVQYEEAA